MQAAAGEPCFKGLCAQVEEVKARWSDRVIHACRVSCSCVQRDSSPIDSWTGVSSTLHISMTSVLLVSRKGDMHLFVHSHSCAQPQLPRWKSTQHPICRDTCRNQSVRVYPFWALRSMAVMQAPLYGPAPMKSDSAGRGHTDCALT